MSHRAPNGAQIFLVTDAINIALLRSAISRFRFLP